MSNGGSPAVASAGSSTGGGGIAFLRRQFELRIDAASAPMKPPPPAVRKRPVSLRDTKPFSKPTPVRPKPREASSLSELASSPPKDTSLTSTSVTSSSSSAYNSSSSSHPAADAVAGGYQATASDQQLEDIKEILDERASNDLIGHPVDADQTETSEFHPSDVHTSNGADESTAECSQTEVNKPKADDDTSILVVTTQPIDSSNETSNDTTGLNSKADECDIAIAPVCIPPRPDSSGGDVGMKGTEEQSGTQVEHGAKQNMPEQETVFAAKRNLTGQASLLSSDYPKKKWMPVARSMEDLCGSTASVEPTRKALWEEKKPGATKVPLTANSANVVSSSQSLDRSASVANIAKPVLRAKKPPPPVPKKNVKFSESSKPSQAVHDAAKEDANTKPKTSDLNNQSKSDGDNPSETDSDYDGEQRQRSATVSSSTKPTVSRPNSLFPPIEATGILHALESNHNRHKSLPSLSHLDSSQGNGGVSPVCNGKDTLFPSSRQKLRPNVLLRSSHSGAATETLTPDFCQGRSIGASQLVLESPMSLGCRTPPDVDSMISSPNSGECLPNGHQPSTVLSNCPLPTPVDSDASGTMEPDFVQPPQSSDEEALDTTSTPSAAEQQVNVVDQPSETSDADSLLEDAFDFLGGDPTPSIEDGRYASSLSLWTETWCKGSTTNLTDSPLQASTTSKVNDIRKGNDKSSNCDDKAQSNTFKSRLRTAGKMEEESQTMMTEDKPVKSTKGNDEGQNGTVRIRLRTAEKMEEERQRIVTEDKPVVKRMGSFALGGNRKTPGDSAETAEVERPNPFGVTLRPKSICSLSRSSTFLSTSDSSSSLASSPVAAAAAAEPSRRSTVIQRTSSSNARSLSRLSSFPSLTILPSNRPTPKLPGKFIGGKPSVVLDEASSSNEKDRKTDLETELEAIDEAFDFLDGTGA